MGFDVKELKEIAAKLQEEIQNHYIDGFVQLCSDVFYFHLGKKKRLTIVAYGSNPRVYISPLEEEFSSLSSPFSALIRKECSHALLLSIDVFNDDRILKFSLLTLNNVYKETRRSLVIELLPNRSNLLLLDENDVIIGAVKYTSINEARPIIKGLNYLPPVKNSFVEKKNSTTFDYEEYLKVCFEKEDELFEKRKKELFHPLYLHLANRKKALARKRSAIEEDLAKAKLHLNDGEIGDYIFTNYSEINPKEGFVFAGTKIELDPRRNLAQNAELFYKRQKKAKQTFANGQVNLQKVQKEENEILYLISLLPNADENTLKQISLSLGLEKDAKKKAKKDDFLAKGNWPYFVIDNGVTYLFGKSAAQNDFLSFVYDTAKTHTWMHLKDHTGAHLIIKKDNATEGEIALAGELLCLCSKVPTGEAVYTLRKNVRKGKVPGQAILSAYQSFMVKNVSVKAKDLYLQATRIKSI